MAIKAGEEMLFRRWIKKSRANLRGTVTRLQDKETKTRAETVHVPSRIPWASVCFAETMWIPVRQPPRAATDY